MYFRQPTDKIARVAQDFPIDRAERIEVSIVEVAEARKTWAGSPLNISLKALRAAGNGAPAEIISAISR